MRVSAINECIICQCYGRTYRHSNEEYRGRDQVTDNRILVARYVRSLPPLNLSKPLRHASLTLLAFSFFRLISLGLNFVIEPWMLGFGP